MCVPAGLRRDEERVAVEVGVVGPLLGLLLAAALGELVGDDLLPLRPRTRRETASGRASPKMYSLNSEASILPRRMSAAAKRWRSSWGSVSTLREYAPTAL